MSPRMQLSVPKVLVLLLLCSQLFELAQSLSEVESSQGIAVNTLNVQRDTQQQQHRQLASAAAAIAQKTAAQSADIHVTTAGAQCRRKVFDGLAVAIQGVVSAKTAPGRRKLVAVTKKTCKKVGCSSSMAYTFL